MGFAPQLHYVKYIPKKSSTNWRATLGVRENSYRLIKGSPSLKKSNTRFKFKGKSAESAPLNSNSISKPFSQRNSTQQKKSIDNNRSFDSLQIESYSNAETIPIKIQYVRDSASTSNPRKSNCAPGTNLKNTSNAIGSTIELKPVDNVLNIEPYPPDLWK